MRGLISTVPSLIRAWTVELETSVGDGVIEVETSVGDLVVVGNANVSLRIERNKSMKINCKNVRSRIYVL